MRDIPMFSTEHGVASLILREIVYKKEAYVRIHSSDEIDEFLKDVTGFCKAAGAERIYATGHSVLEGYPVHTVLVGMICKRSLLRRSDAVTVQVSDQTIDQWRELYNKRMSGVPNAATVTIADANKFVAEGAAYFVFRENICIGLGKVSYNKIEAIISLVPGAGECVLLALNNLVSGEFVQVEVALNNDKAVKLYKRLGFEVVEEISKWYCI